ncbi:Peptidase C97 domain containing protein [Asbolus verrucosus]|uniref:Peptidase C97 domain containing protein n=1 Tax=Asbolus verrucosus TaxID=1661398 RepID=A0A482VIM8_ASBVE|nr:Peptidase C97 domain containing protein [Asbolus verrucosus]
MFSNAVSAALTCHFPCIRFSRDSDSDEIISKKPHEPVLLNVYDMYKINEYTSNIGIGIFHSGVEVYGVEYGYGGHQYPYSGIFDMQPRNINILGEYFNLQNQLRFRQTIHIGHTNFTSEEVTRITKRLGRKFRGDKYHLINNNCNHFSGAFTKILCQKNIPSWVNRLAYVSSFVPFLHKFLPEEWIAPCTIKKSNNTQSSD